MFELVCVLSLVIKVLVVISAVITLFYILDSALRASKEGDMPKTTDDVELPSIYVNEDLLPDKRLPIGAEYIVNEEVFIEGRNSDNSLVEFEVIKMESEGDMYCSTPSCDSDNGDYQESELNMTIQPVANGYIVNGNCYLSWQQWHTLVTPQVSIKLLHCVVCAQYCEVDASRDHVITVDHRMALEAFPPLDKFDLSIIRKIRNQYHCAVCNELFDVSSEFDHSGGKMHEGNLLFAINKASDLLDNSYEQNDTDKIDTYHFKTHAMNSAVNDTESVGSNDNYNYVNFQNNYFYDDFEEEAPPAFSGLSYATMAKKPKINTQSFIDVDLGNKKVTVRYDSWHMVISPKLNRFWCMVCKKFDHIRKKKEHCSEMEHLNNLHRCKVVEAYDEYFIRQVDDKLYHCGHCNNLQMIHEMEDHVETNHPRKKLVTEAKNLRNSPSKTTNNPQTQNDTNGATKNIPQINKNDTNGVKKISYDEFMNSFNKANNPTGKNNTVQNSNNMPQIINAVANTNNDKAINANTIIDKKPINTSNDIRVTNTINNNTVDKIPVTNTQNDNHHINTRNDGAITNAINNNIINDKSITNARNDNHPITNARNDNHPITNARNDNHPITNARNDNSIKNDSFKNDFSRPILESITLYPFGNNITLPWLAYNIVCERPNDYYCGLCDVVCQEAGIVHHMYEVRHLELLQRTPFILPFANNLIRAIRDALHCAICNIPVSASEIYNHIQNPQHLETLSKALNQGPKLPPIGVKIPNVPETPAKFKTPNISGPILSPNVNNAQRVNIANKENTGNNNNITKVTEYNNNRHNNFTNDEEPEDEILEMDDNDDDYEDIDTGDEIDKTFDSIASEDARLDEEEHVYLKLKNTYIKISSTSFNTLVHIGDGSRYCFVCAITVQYMELQKHVDARTHLENIGKYMFLDKYEDHLLRQIYLMYHCAICNVIISRKELKAHLEWPTHALQNVTLKNIKKTRKTEIKGGVKQIVVSTQKENIYLHENEPKIKICMNVEVTDEKSKKADKKQASKEVFSKKNKIIIFNDNVLKVSWESWHAISKIKNGYKCNLCQRELKSADIDVHCTSEWHRYGLDKPFEKQFAPALIRKINDSTLNCLFCNTEVSNKEHLVTVHVNGKKHQKNYEEILKDSSLANTYTDCHDDVLML